MSPIRNGTSPCWRFVGCSHAWAFRSLSTLKPSLGHPLPSRLACDIPSDLGHSLTIGCVSQKFIGRIDHGHDAHISCADPLTELLIYGRPREARKFPARPGAKSEPRQWSGQSSPGCASLGEVRRRGNGSNHRLVLFTHALCRLSYPFCSLPPFSILSIFGARSLAAMEHCCPAAIASRMESVRRSAACNRWYLHPSVQSGCSVEMVSSRVESPPPDHVFFFGRSARSCRNSPGPFRSRRFLCWRSSAVADGSASLSICWPARSRAVDAAFGLRCFIGCDPASPSSTSRRMASERPGLSVCLAAQASTFSRNSDESRMAVTGSCPVAGRPLFFRTTFLLAAFIFIVLR
jgi:hypothetical protein